MQTKGRKMLPIVLGISVVVIVVIVGAVIILSRSSNVGDAAKFDRSFISAEEELIASVDISADELAAATCEEGRKCWVAVNRIVYDVSAIPSWVRGKHHGLVAGADHTEAFLKSIHGVDTLQKLPVVGSYPSGVSVDSLK